eukprot:3119093-Prymnesium_polylepis.1
MMISSSPCPRSSSPSFSSPVCRIAPLALVRGSACNKGKGGETSHHPSERGRPGRPGLTVDCFARHDLASLVDRDARSVQVDRHIARQHVPTEAHRDACVGHADGLVWLEAQSAAERHRRL